MKSESFKLNTLITVLVCLAVLIGSCTDIHKKTPPHPEPVALVRLEPSQYPVFADDIEYNGLIRGIRASLTFLKKIPPARKFRFGEETFDAAYMIRSFDHFLSVIQNKPTAQALSDIIRSQYLVYQANGKEDAPSAFFTGYYEPQLQGRLQAGGEYKYPIYGRPDDLYSIDLALFSSEFKGKKIYGRYAPDGFTPYFNRNEIENLKALESRAEPLAWVKDRIALFFLHIQGSGRIVLKNGDVIHVCYDAQNGRPYRSIGKLLIEQKKITKDAMSMQKIREYLTDHPDETDAILNYNPSYIFFTLQKDGPYGSLGVKLTPGRSIATDRRIYPPAALAFIQTRKPVTDPPGQIRSWVDFSRFVLNQDTGGAIKGPGRADLFWGSGHYAEIAAGHLKHPGNMYFLILKPDV